MKKLSFLLMICLTAWSFEACNNAEDNDAVENANEANENKRDDDTSGAAIGATTSVDADDSKFLVDAASGGMMEVELGQIAQSKATDQRVKDFAAMMVRDHSAANDELKALAARKNVTLPTTPGEKHQKHIADLKDKTGSDFDKAYMDMMVEDHNDDVEAFEKASNNAKDADIKAFASKTLPVLKSHHDQAKTINDAVK